ncbi:hypothetical protein [Pseudolactococcus yaeyamensis]
MDKKKVLHHSADNFEFELSEFTMWYFNNPDIEPIDTYEDMLEALKIFKAEVLDLRKESKEFVEIMCRLGDIGHRHGLVVEVSVTKYFDKKCQVMENGKD